MTPGCQRARFSQRTVLAVYMAVQPYFIFIGGSRGSTPEQEREGRLGTSPHINRFLAREPPDGCEKVNTKFVEDVR